MGCMDRRHVTVTYLTEGGCGAILWAGTRHRERGVWGMEQPSTQRGLMKLMLRLPAMRGQLQILSARNPSLLNLCDAFDDASVMLEKLRKDLSADKYLLDEYEKLCHDIESEVVELCILLGGSGR